MANYKGQARRIIIGNVEIPVPAGAVIKTLYDPVLLSTAADALLYQNSTYQVPTGKTFHMIGMRLTIELATGSGNVIISQGDTEDAETLVKVTITYTSNPTNDQEIYGEEEFTTGKFITVKSSAATLEHIIIIGYETTP